MLKDNYLFEVEVLKDLIHNDGSITTTQFKNIEQYIDAIAESNLELIDSYDKLLKQCKFDRDNYKSKMVPNTTIIKSPKRRRTKSEETKSPKQMRNRSPRRKRRSPRRKRSRSFKRK